MREEMKRAELLLKEWKGDSYAFGEGVLKEVGPFAARFGKSALIIVADLGEGWVQEPLEEVKDSLGREGVSFEAVSGARPNAPREDLYRIALQVEKARPASIIALGGGSTIDAAKAASVLASYSPPEVEKCFPEAGAEASSIEPFFGTDTVTKIRDATGRGIIPVVAIQTAASSAAHLTKYSNITDPVSGQKKLIVDEAIVPPAALFDFNVTLGTPKDLTLDGGLDGIAHSWEVLMGAVGKPFYGKAKEIAELSIRLIVKSLPMAVRDGSDREARTALGLGTDLGGYAIMVGGTSGGHLGSFSLVDVLSHGRACAVLNPYYTVLFAPAIEEPLRIAGAIYKEAGFIDVPLEGLKGMELGGAVARGMIDFSRSLGFPTTLKEAGASTAHIERMVAAAKNPQLRSKLENMPLPMYVDKGDVDRLMKPTLEAAFTGGLKSIPNP